jgi:hypothetical protein
MSLRKCLDEAALQKFLDAELSPEETLAAEAHLAACEACAAALGEAQSELAFFAETFAPDTSISVPTERLRTRIEAAIADQRASQIQHAATEERWSLRNWFASLAASLTLSPANVAAFASLAAIIVFGVIFAVVQSRLTNTTPGETERQEIATTSGTSEETTPTVNGTDNSKNKETNVAANTTKNPGEDLMVKVSSTRERPRHSSNRVKRPSTRAAKTDAGNALLPGEGDYLEAIASLDKVIDAGGDLVLRPSERADYERNLALVDEAIRASRRNALRNRRDPEATQFLYSAYKNKVELMNAVAGQTQFAALGR